MRKCESASWDCRHKHMGGWGESFGTVQHPKVVFRYVVKFWGCYNVDVEEYELGDLDEPPHYKAVLADPKSDKWLEDINTKMQSMKDNQVLYLVDLPSNGRTVGCKRLFNKKTNMDGIVQTFKARLVAKGFTQTYIVDYRETLSLVADIRVIRILLAITAFYDYKIWQMDVKTAFLNGHLSEDQASRSWNKRFDEEIQKIIFTQNPDEPCVYLKASGSNVAFLVIMKNSKKGYTPIMEKPDYRKLQDDEPMWAADRVVAPTLGFAITIPETANEFAIKGRSNSNTNKIMAQMDAMTIKIDAQYKELQYRAKQSTPDHDDDDMPMSHEEEAKFMQTFHKTRFYNDYRDRDSNRDNWRSSGRNDYNRDNYRSNTDDKPYDLQKQFNDFMKSQQSTNAFVKETFMDLKTQLETVAKNHQALIQNLETKFDKLTDK
nr:hypothetical protein [Tanacetum cinerariifolium]